MKLKLTTCIITLLLNILNAQSFNNVDNNFFYYDSSISNQKIILDTNFIDYPYIKNEPNWIWYKFPKEDGSMCNLFRLESQLDTVLTIDLMPSQIKSLLSYKVSNSKSYDSLVINHQSEFIKQRVKIKEQLLSKQDALNYKDYLYNMYIVDPIDINYVRVLECSFSLYENSFWE